MRYFISSIILMTLLGAELVAAQGTDEVGIYFDTGYSQTSIDVETTPGFLAGYLVMHNPSAAGGVGGWELCAGIEGPAQFSSWVLEGDNINTSTPPCFTVGIGASPLPSAPDVLLATFQLIVTDVQPVTLTLEPKYNASIPDRMSYLDGADLGHIIPLQTTTTVPQVAFINDSNPWYDLNDTAHDFGDVYIGQTASKTISVTNTGGGFLVLDIHLSPEDPAFTLGGTTGIVSLGAGETAYVIVNFTPQGEGLVSTHLVFGGIVPDVYIQGNGVEPPITLIPQPDSLAFGEVQVGQSAALSLTIWNHSPIPVTVDPVLDDPDGAFTIIAGVGEHIITPGRGQVVGVEFSPPTAGDFSADLGFYPGEPAVPLSGTGTVPTVGFTLVPDSLSLGEIAAGYTVEGKVTLTNTGDLVLDIDPHLAAASSVFTVVSGDGPAQVQPGETHEVTVSFSAAELGDFQTTLVMGDVVPDVPVTASAVEASPGCTLSTTNLVFGDVTVAGTATRYLTITNTGNVPLDIAPTIPDCAYFTAATGPLTVMPGQQATVQVDFQPLSEGFWTCQLDLGDSSCSSVILSGSASGFNGGGDGVAAIFFDSGYRYSITGTTVPDEIVTAYLVLQNPENTSGVGGWEGCLGLQGDAQFVDFDIQGQFINVETPPCFLVGIGGSPLPYAPDILLAGFRFLVATSWSDVDVTLGPIYHASIPGYSAWIPWDDPDDITPMQNYAGDVVLASVTSNPLGVETPRPSAVLTGGGVTVTWRLTAEGGEGCHLYRRSGDREPVRLTDELLRPRGTEFSYTDPATGILPGTVLYYSYAVVHGGSEDQHSPEVALTLGGVPVNRARLLANVPNPFNPMTEVRFETAENGHVRVTIYDVTGRLVRTLVNEDMGPGPHSRLWQGRDDAGRPVPSGAYYLRLEANGNLDHRKVMLLK